MAAHVDIGCTVAGCDELARRGGLCSTHDKRRVRHAPMSVVVVKRHENPVERLREAALAYADADAEDDVAFTRADDRLRKSAIHYVESLPRYKAVAVRREPEQTRNQMHLWRDE